MIGIFDCWRRLLPRTTLQKIAPQRLAAGDQAVMAVGWRELRQERERLVTRFAPAASNPNPVMVLVVSLFAAAAMPDNRITLTTGAAPQEDLLGENGPITFQLALIGGKWDKKNRSKWRLLSGGELAKLGARREPLLLRKVSLLKKNNKPSPLLLRAC